MGSAAVVDSLDHVINRLSDQGIDIEARTKNALLLLERLTEPATVALLGGALEHGKQAPNLAAVALDIVDDRIARLATAGLDIDERLRVGARLLERLTSPPAMEAFCALLDHAQALGAISHSGLFSSEALALLNQMGAAVGAAASEPPKRIGAFGALRALGKPEMQQALGLVLSIGAHLGAARARNQLPQGNQ